MEGDLYPIFSVSVDLDIEGLFIKMSKSDLLDQLLNGGDGGCFLGIACPGRPVVNITRVYIVTDFRLLSKSK